MFPCLAKTKESPIEAQGNTGIVVLSFGGSQANGSLGLGESSF